MKNKIIELITEHADKHGVNNYIELITKIQDMEFSLTLQQVKKICKNNINSEPENCPFTECSTALCAGCIFMHSPNDWDI
jgi:hypothetical protein